MSKFKQRLQAYQAQTKEDDRYMDELNTANRLYYREFLASFTSQITYENDWKPFRRGEIASDILAQIWQAQQNQQSAEEYFGMPANELGVKTSKGYAPKRAYLPTLAFFFVLLVAALLWSIHRKDISSLFIVLYLLGNSAIVYLTNRIFIKENATKRTVWRWTGFVLWLLVAVGLATLFTKLLGW